MAKHSRMADPQPAGSRGEAWGRTLCPYCGVGCGLLVQVEDGAVKRVKGDPDHPSSLGDVCAKAVHLPPALDRKSTRLNSSHVRISYAVFCLKKKKHKQRNTPPQQQLSHTN